ncbi:MAG TPA: sulfatase-like hydrolase/transferase [Chloroflexota bacterium]|nr:sulfatase-like hydrolase/transferase [Chloroflexota bacterium]
MPSRSEVRLSPNVLFILTDQQRWDTVGANGCPLDLTPNLDRMARQGVRFANAFTCQPVCAPARACLQTGKYATKHGVWRNGLRLSREERTLAHYFKDAGYDVGYIGKWHLAQTGKNPVPADLRGGYVDHWQAADLFEFTSHPYETVLFDENNQEVRPEGYRVDATTDLAVDFLRNHTTNPFFLYLSYLEPHHQNDLNRYVAPEGYAERYANAWVPGDLAGRPGDWLSQLPDYYGIIARIDECLGRILGELDRLGLTENTIVFFTSDHGSHFRTRNAEYKRSCHEGSIHVPAVVRGPGLPRGRVVDRLVSLIDFPPTLLDAAGIPVPSVMQGRSTLPLLREEPNLDWPEEVFLQISESEVGRAIRTPRWKYAVFAPEKDGWKDSASGVYVERYLYNLGNDPYERVNLVGRPDHAEIAQQLRERLIARMVAAGEPAPTIVPAKYQVW